MKKQLVVTDAAKRDLRNIRDYIAQESPQQAQIFAADLAAKIIWLAEVDFTGAPRNHIREGLRALPYKKRCIYYRTLNDKIVIIRVLHDAQDIAQIEFDGGE